MENCEAVVRIMRPPHRPRRPRGPEAQRLYQAIEDLRENNPELLKSELAKIKEARTKPKRIIQDPEIYKMDRAAFFERRGPVKLYYVPRTVRDTTEASCDTKHQADHYKRLANADPREVLFKVVNPATRLPDEVLTACVIKRYREDQCNSIVNVVAPSDDVQGTSVLKRHREEIGESSETMVTTSDIAAASVLKHHREDLGEPSETVVAACGNN